MKTHKVNLSTQSDFHSIKKQLFGSLEHAEDRSDEPKSFLNNIFPFAVVISSFLLFILISFNLNEIKHILLPRVKTIQIEGTLESSFSFETKENFRGGQSVRGAWIIILEEYPGFSFTYPSDYRIQDILKYPDGTKFEFEENDKVKLEIRKRDFYRIKDKENFENLKAKERRISFYKLELDNETILHKCCLKTIEQ